MCQLLGLNAAAPTDICSVASLPGFCQRGGGTDIHAHGFGIALYDVHGQHVRRVDTQAAAHSSLAQTLLDEPPFTDNMLAHIRYATSGDSDKLENVHPFTRTLWGCPISFAHNGQVPKYDGSMPLAPPLLGKTRPEDVYFRPYGNTDSEATFCAILNALRVEFAEEPSQEDFQACLNDLTAEIVQGQEQSTILNFLMTFGRNTLYAYSWPGKRPHSTTWNGLYYLERRQSNHSKRDSNTHQNPAVVVTTKPLTDDEGWKEFDRGQLLRLERGSVVSQHPYPYAHAYANPQRWSWRMPTPVRPRIAPSPPFQARISPRWLALAALSQIALVTTTGWNI